MSFFTAANASIAVSAALPATFDAAGFAALTYIPIGEVTSLGSVKGRTYNLAKHAPVSSAQQIEKKASYTLGSADFMVAWDAKDAGQMIIDAAEKDYKTYAFKVTLQDGSINYFTAQVMKFVQNVGTVDNVVQGDFALLRQTDSITVPPAP